MNKTTFAPIVAPEVLQKLSIVPQLAAKYGRGFTLLDAGEIKYFPLDDVPTIPGRFAEAIATYDVRSEAVLINDRNLSKCSWMLVPLDSSQSSTKRSAYSADLRPR